MANGRTFGGHIKTINALAPLYSGLVIYFLIPYPNGCCKNTNNSSIGNFARNALIGTLNLDLNSTWWMLRTRRRIVKTGFVHSRVNYYANSTATMGDRSVETLCHFRLLIANFFPNLYNTAPSPLLNVGFLVSRICLFPVQH